MKMEYITSQENQHSRKHTGQERGTKHRRKAGFYRPYLNLEHLSHASGIISNTSTKPPKKNNERQILYQNQRMFKDAIFKIQNVTPLTEAGSKSKGGETSSTNWTLPQRSGFPLKTQGKTSLSTPHFSLIGNMSYFSNHPSPQSSN